MKKVTLKFHSLRELAAFSKTLTGSFILNTCNLTITSIMTDQLIDAAFKHYYAKPVSNTDKVFTYDALI
jgi:hypothetical protein